MRESLPSEMHLLLIGLSLISILFYSFFDRLRREIIQNLIQNLTKSLFILFNFVSNFVGFLPACGHP